MGVVVFASADAAATAAHGPRRYTLDDNRAWNVESVTVYEQLTSRPPRRTAPRPDRPPRPTPKS